MLTYRWMIHREQQLAVTDTPRSISSDHNRHPDAHLRPDIGAITTTGGTLEYREQEPLIF